MRAPPYAPLQAEQREQQQTLPTQLPTAAAAAAVGGGTLRFATKEAILKDIQFRWVRLCVNSDTIAGERTCVFVCACCCVFVYARACV